MKTSERTTAQNDPNIVMYTTACVLLYKWYDGCFKPRCCTVRLYWAKDNLGYRDEFWYESCPRFRMDHLTCWPAVQRTTSVPRLHSKINGRRGWFLFWWKTKVYHYERRYDDAGFVTALTDVLKMARWFVFMPGRSVASCDNDEVCLFPCDNDEVVYFHPVRAF